MAASPPAGAWPDSGHSAQASNPARDMNIRTLPELKLERDGEILRSIKTLESINDKPAAEFWKEFESK